MILGEMIVTTAIERIKGVFWGKSSDEDAAMARRLLVDELSAAEHALAVYKAKVARLRAELSSNDD